MGMKEYAKFVRVRARERGRGVRAHLRLPDAVTFTSDSGNFINFYVAFADYECGISTAVGRAGWRWFANSVRRAENQGGTFGEFHNGESVEIRLHVNEWTQQTEFWVNGACRHIFPRTTKPTVTYADCRLVFGALTALDDGGPLPPWASWHREVKASDIMMKNKEANWVALDQTRAVIEVFHEPRRRECPPPQNYDCDDSRLHEAIVISSLWPNPSPSSRLISHPTGPDR